ncbi:MAG: hypothetical protein U1F43_10570 [Myxococcota bacterium]
MALARALRLFAFVCVVSLASALGAAARAGIPDLGGDRDGDGPRPTRVIVRIAEEAHGFNGPASATEIAQAERQLVVELRSAGFVVLEGAAVELAFPIARVPSVVGSAAAARVAATIATELGADYAVIGRAHRTGPKAKPKAPVTRTARLELVAVRATSAEIVAHAADQATTTEASAELARNVALATAGRHLMPRFVATLGDHCALEPALGFAPSQQAGLIQIAIAFPKRSYNWAEIMAFKQEALDYITGVSDVSASGRDARSATLDLAYHGTSKELAARLAKKVAATKKYKVKRIDASHIVVEVRK